ncbi:MAG: OmpH family outer membrane protein [Endomicrobium sp.]|jgi:Skp family chaperone for outer membrane proteins|nr:OmpH family outer membrane protein [Endomicrobium sp.]
MVFNKNFLLLFLFFFVPTVFCFEIPINGAVERIDEPVENEAIQNNIICVDIEKVFNSHPMTLEYKREIKSFGKTRKDIIDNLVKELNALKEQAKVVNLKISEAKSENRSFGDLLKQLNDIRGLINDKKLEISDLAERTKTEIVLMEERNTAEVLKDIESLLKEELKKYKATIVLDKQSVITEKCKDVTNEVIKMAKDR